VIGGLVWFKHITVHIRSALFRDFICLQDEIREIQRVVGRHKDVERRPGIYYACAEPE